MAVSSLPEHTEHPSWIASEWWAHITAITLVVIELCWVAPWYRTVIEISVAISALRAVLVLGGIMTAAYAFSFLMETLHLINTVTRLVLLLLYLVFFLLGAQILLGASLPTILAWLVEMRPGVVLVAITTLWLWWRGVTLGHDPIRPLVVWRRFALALFMVLAHVFIVTRMRASLLGAAPGLSLLTFFLLTSLFGMVFARISFVSLSHGVKRNPFDRRWLVSTSFIIGSVVGIAMFLGVLLTGQYTLLLDQIAEGVRWVAIIFLFVVSLPWLLLSYIFGPLIPLLRQFMPTPQPTAVPLVDPYAAPYAMPPLEVAEIKAISTSMQLFIFWAIIFLVLASLFLARRGLGRRRRAGSDEAESLMERGDLMRLLRNLIRNGLEDASNAFGRLRPDQRKLAAARIRRIYSLLLELCSELDRVRQPWQTPLEFLPEMGELFHDHNAQLALITHAYIRVRYGELPETQAEVNAIEVAWSELLIEGKRLKRARMSALKTADLDEARRVKM